MLRSPYLIVKEFCDSDNEQQRKSAVTALATFADQESLDELVRMGLNEASPKVRECIEIEIAGLQQPERSKIADAIIRQVEEPGPTSRGAYRLLGELRSRGVQAALPRLSILRRLKLAKSLHFVVYPNRSLRSRGRGALAALFGATAAAILAGLIQTVAIHQPGAMLSDLYGFLFFSGLIAITTAVLSMQFSSPIGLHADRLAIAYFDLLTTAGVSILVSAIIVLIIGVSHPGTRVGVAAALMLPTLAIATRLAMLATLGVFKGTAANVWTGILCGASAGTLAMSLVPAFLGVGDSVIMSNLWFILVPVAAGLAAPWAQQDASAAGKFTIPLALRIAGALPLLMLAVAITFLVDPWVTITVKPDVFSAVVVNGPDSSVRQPLSIHAVPANIPLQIEQPVQIRVSLMSQMEPALWQAGVMGRLSGIYVAPGKSSVLLLENLSVGSQDLTVTCPTCDTTPLLSLVFEKLGWFLRIPAPSRVLGNVSLAFGPPAPVPTPSRPYNPVARPPLKAPAHAR
jgi:hypothetical protein